MRKENQEQLTIQEQHLWLYHQHPADTKKSVKMIKWEWETERQREEGGRHRKRDHLMDCKTGVNPCTIYLFSLDIKSPYRRTHSLWTYSNHTDVLGEIKSYRLQMTKKKPMGKPKYAVWLHVGEYFLIIVSLEKLIKLYPFRKIQWLGTEPHQVHNCIIIQ